MKRSRSIRLVLIGGLSAGALTSCGPDDRPPVSASSVYTNNYFVPGVGYYHAPFRAFFPIPYSHFEPGNQKYFYGGKWGDAPHQSITNISTPLPGIAQQAQAQRMDVRRGGFGRSSSSHFISS